jgi:RNA polymerase sigma-70 factor (ECF subfamily)
MASPDPYSSPEPSIDELIALILGGETDLYEEIIRRYQREVLRVVGMLLYDRDAAEELAQKVFADAYFALPAFRPGSDFGPWIRTIARNAAREELRKQSRYDRRLKAYAEMLCSRLSGSEGWARDEQSLAAALEQCLGRLSEREVTAVRLRYEEGRSFDQIADELGGTGGTIRNLLCRVRGRLRECLARQGNQP